MPFSEALARHRVAVASNLALVLALGTVVAVAWSADGFKSHETRLNDGGIWVTTSELGMHGRINKPIDQLDGAVFADQNAQLDVVQQGAAVVAIDQGSGTLSPIDPAKVAHPEGEEATMASGGQVRLNGGSLAVLQPESGQVWAERVDPEAGQPLVGGLDAEAPPLATVGAKSSLAVASSGDLLVASADDDTLTRIPTAQGGFGSPEVTELGADLSDQLAVTAVGDVPVVLDRATGVLRVPDGPEVVVATGAVLQEAGPSASEVLVATSDRLVAIDLDSGEETTVVDGVGGDPAAPVRLGACRYGAWSGQQPLVAVGCGSDEPRVSELDVTANDLVFRVNRGEIVLNDRPSGAVWNIDSDNPSRIDNWDAFRTRNTDDEESDREEQDKSGDRRPPKAEDDEFGARPGRTTVLYPLDNDTAPKGRLLAIREVSKPTGSRAELDISPDGQTVQIRLPEGAGTTTFEYHIDDGRDASDSATVTVFPRGESVNKPPELRDAFEPTVWKVPSGGTIDVPVLPDWRDYGDGDPLSLGSAVAKAGARSGAVARATSSGRVRFTAPTEPGRVTVDYDVLDSFGGRSTETLEFEVQPKLATEAFPATAEPDVVTGRAGEPIVIRPLANDLPGSDPLSPQASVQLAGEIAPVGGADVQTDLVEGTVTFTADRPRTYFFDYAVAYGNAPFDEGRVRVDVRPDDKRLPVAMPDQLTVYGQTPALVDVLANDIDPAGGMLVVQSAEPTTENQLDVAVVEGRWLRIAPRGGSLQPRSQLVRYTISNGVHSGVVGEVMVNQRDAPDDTAPVTEVDRVTVRAGGQVRVPVLDNDFSPIGDELSLVTNVAGNPAGRLTVLPPGEQRIPTGQAHTSGRFVRYVAPRNLDDAETLTVRYVARNSLGETTPGDLEVTVVPAKRKNQPPQPPMIEGRSIAGETLKLEIPGSGVDPDGDPVTLTGIESAPRLGRVLQAGGDSLRYQAYPGSVGTDEFQYTVTDPHGATGTGTVRVAVVPPGAPQPPLAVPDTITVEPGRTAHVDVLGNDVVAAGDRVEVQLVDPPEGVELASPQGPVLVETPEGESAEGRNVEAVYRVGNGIATSQASVTVRTASPYNNPPVVQDAFGDVDDGATVTVDVLENAYDPDGDVEELAVDRVFTPPGVSASIEGGEITVDRVEHPAVYPFKVVDADGGATTAQVYVPPLNEGAPYLAKDAELRVEPGQSVTAQLDDYVVNPSGGPVRFTLKDRIWVSPEGRLDAQVLGDQRFEVGADEGFAGPAAVSFEVTTGTSVDDPEGVRAVLSLPVQVGDSVPILQCPEEPIEIVQDQRLTLDVASVCHVWTSDADADLPTFTADWSRSVEGLSLVEPEGTEISVAASGSARPGAEATLSVRAADGEPAELHLRVTEAPPPSITPIRVSDMRAGESRTIDLAQYLRPGVDSPEPTVVSATQTTDLDVGIEKDGGSAVRITTADRVDGRAIFSVTMSDVAGSTGPERQVEGRIQLEILDVPDAPSAPVPGNAVRDREVVLSWQAPDDNGAPIDRYRVTSPDGVQQECPATRCEIGGLTNGQQYRFQVEAHNAVGWSQPSQLSRPATPDAKPGRVGSIQLVEEGDTSLTIKWTPPTTQTSPIRRYHVSFPGGSPRQTSNTQMTIPGLDNNKSYAFTVIAENDFDRGEPRTSAQFQSVGTPCHPDGCPQPTITDQRQPGDQGAVTLSWPKVNPNGPTPVLYTVLHNGSPLAACRNQRTTSCDHGGITYDGAQHRYAVRAVNKGGDGRSATGPAASWSAVGVPAAWGDWQLRPTGRNSEAQATFTVPNARGAQSQVQVLVNGAVTQTFQATGSQTRTISVPSNDRSHSVRLRVCNEAPACQDSATKSVQTYGPLTQAHIISARANRNGTSVSWTITVDANGDPAQVRVRSAKRDQTFQATNVDRNTFTTRSVDLGYSYTENITVTLSDSSPNRGSASKQFSVTTPDPPPISVSVTRGERCQDNNPNIQNCQGGGGGGGTPCQNTSCGFVSIRTDNFRINGWNRSETTCTLHDPDGQFGSRKTVAVDSGFRQTNGYYGYQKRIYAICEGPNGSVRSDPYSWPSR